MDGYFKIGKSLLELSTSIDTRNQDINVAIYTDGETSKFYSMLDLNSFVVFQSN